MCLAPSFTFHMVQGNPELEAVWRLLQYCWAQQYEGIWSALQGYAWTPQASCSSSSSSRAVPAPPCLVGGLPAKKFSDMHCAGGTLE
jgi:hypothetical protein